jgi:hypothetical protein
LSEAAGQRSGQAENKQGEWMLSMHHHGLFSPMLGIYFSFSFFALSGTVNNG